MLPSSQWFVLRIGNVPLISRILDWFCLLTAIWFVYSSFPTSKPISVSFHLLFGDCRKHVPRTTNMYGKGTGVTFAPERGSHSPLNQKGSHSLLNHNIFNTVLNPLGFNLGTRGHLYVVVLDVRSATTPLGFIFCCNWCKENHDTFKVYILLHM